MGGSLCNLPLPPGFDAETLARRTLDALRAGDVVSAVESSQYFLARFPHMQESLLLHAVALSQAGESAVEAALQAWNTVLRRNPLQQDYLAQALHLALRCNSSEYFERWLKLLANVFLVAPPVSLLQKLDEQSREILGSIGIHNGKLRGWTWQHLDKNDGLPHVIVENGSVSAPELTMGPMRRLKTTERVLNIFSIDLPKVRGSYTVRVQDAHHRDVQGSPAVVSCAERCLQQPRGLSSTVSVIIPVFADRLATLACIGSALASRKANTTPFELVVVWDHGPDQRLCRDLQRLAARGKLFLHTPPHNMGFLAAVNFALERHPGQPVVLLNADTLVCGNWLDRLHRIGSRQGVATVTPFGTHAELLSFPEPQVKASVNSLRQVRRLDEACKKANADDGPKDIPVGVGFCMYISRAALAKLAGLDGHALFRGYGEEVEYCLRAKKHGLRNVAACNVFVGHVGERSFGAGKAALVKQNNEALFLNYPDYKAEYDTFVAVDPLRPFRIRAAKLALMPLAGSLHVANTLMGASPELVNLRAQGKEFALLLFQPCGNNTRAMLRVQQGLPLPDLHFLVPQDFSSLSRILARLAPLNIVSHGSSPLVGRMLERLGLPVSLAKSPVAQIPSMILSETPGKWITPAPRTVLGWQRLCRVALHAQAHGHIFKVLQLDACWKHAPRPLNVWPAPETAKFAPAAESLLLLESADCTAAWQQWADDRNLSAYFLRENPPQTREALCA